MPGALHHSFFFTLSVDRDVLATWTNEINNFCISNTIWYAIKHELGDTEKLHLHGVMIFEIQTSISNGGAKTKSNLTRQLLNHCPHLRDYMIEHPSKHALVMSPLASDELIVGYMQKESSLKYFVLPQDTFELRPYFADLQAVKPSNPQYDKWEKMYTDDSRVLPATLESVHYFFGEHQLTDMKKVVDPRLFNFQCKALFHHINKTVAPFEPPRASKAGSSYGETRFCKRCIDEDVDAPNILEPREQFCALHKKYRN